MKKISVIVPIYNVEKYVSRCISSILSQTYRNIELIIINDGSVQNEDKLIQEYLEKGCDFDIKYIKKMQNEGLFKARITGVENATGDYIAFVDGDDYIDNDFFRSLVRKIEESDADIVYSYTAMFSAEGKNTVFPIMNTVFEKFPLYGNDFKQEYYKQEGTAYVWHTIWNKLYKKELWMKALPFFKTVDKHLVMLEDFLFSSILIYYAQGAEFEQDAVYYYCQHNDSSTGVGNLSCQKYIKNVQDITYVFDKLDEFFDEREKWISDHIYRVRQMYSRIWFNSVKMVEEKDRKECLKILDTLCGDRGLSSTFGDSYFYSVHAEFDNVLSTIKNRLLNGKEEYVSFDIFETAVKRPFYNPCDLFYLLDETFEKLYRCNSSFHTLRIDGENGCRAVSEKEDINLDDIYHYISVTYRIPEEVCLSLRNAEICLEQKYNLKRRFVYSIYSYALDIGKKVIFTSDMYLDENDVENILQKNGYTNYERIFVSSKTGKLKRTGSLYKEIVRQLATAPGKIIHFGDNYYSDYDMAIQCGWNAFYIPNCMDAMEKYVLIDKDRAGINGYGCMIQMVANYYFDNPFRPFNPLTKYGSDPYFMGYYVLGMNIVAQIIKLNKVLKAYKKKRVVFTSRDGYLLKKAYDEYMSICKNKVVTDYRYTSRKAMLPMIVAYKSDFYNLPIVYSKYTPLMICELLSFCSRKIGVNYLKANGWNPYEKFSSIDQYHNFISFFLDNCYSKNKHTKSQNVIRKYYKDICSDDLIYDMGYSAAIHSAITDACKNKPMALFVHTDIDKHMHFMRANQFDIISIMDTIPPVSGVIREYFFSEQAPSCIQYKNTNNNIELVFEEYEKSYTDLFPLLMMQEAALRFNREFWRLFSEYENYIDFRTDDILFPFEDYLEKITKNDLKAFCASFYEDKLYGAVDSINVTQFWEQRLAYIGKDDRGNVESEIERLKHNLGKDKLAFWGTGKVCRRLIAQHGTLQVDYFFDNSETKEGMIINGKKVIKPKDFSNYEDTLIIVACKANLEIEEQLEKNGLKKYKDFFAYYDVF